MRSGFMIDILDGGGHGRAGYFICGRCEKNTWDVAEPVETLCDEVETVRVFCYLGDRVHSNGGSDSRIENWMDDIQRMWGKVFNGNERGGYRNCVKPSMLYGSESRCLKKWRYTHPSV